MAKMIGDKAGSVTEQQMLSDHFIRLGRHIALLNDNGCSSEQEEWDRKHYTGWRLETTYDTKERGVYFDKVNKKDCRHQRLPRLSCVSASAVLRQWHPSAPGMSTCPNRGTRFLPK